MAKTRRASCEYDDVLEQAKRSEVVVYAIGIVDKDAAKGSGWNQADFVAEVAVEGNGRTCLHRGRHQTASAGVQPDRR